MVRHLAPVDAALSSERASAFALLDDTLTEGVGLRGVRLGGASAAAVGAHVARRSRQAGRPSIVVPGAPSSFWREVALLSGVLDLSSDVEAAAEAIAHALSASRAVVIGAPAPTAWDDAVTHAIVRRPLAGLVLLLTDGAVPLSDALGPIGDELSDDGVARWWAAAASEGESAAVGATLARLDGWWAAATRALPSYEPSPVQLDEADRPLLRRLSLAGRAWPTMRLGALGVLGSRARLEQLGVVVTHAGFLVLESPDDSGADATDCRAVAEALARTFAGDAWAHARAAELLARADDPVAAEGAHLRAISLALEATARTDLWARWAAVVGSFAPDVRAACAGRAVETALDRGDADAAGAWAERLVAEAPFAGASLLALGRACQARGDVVAAEAALGRALAVSVGADRARVLASMAEVRYAQGAHADAERAAIEASASAGSPKVRLAARNVLGKLLLARGAFRDAELHFVADAQDAAAHDESSAALRARLNRAIAVLSEGRLGEAKPMLEEVLATGEARGDARAVAFALANLAVLAVNRHDYAEALARNEQAIPVRRRLGERLDLARTITNLAQLRLRLGLVEEAEQALVFGRATLSRGATVPRAAHFALVSAQVHLARGDTLPARRDVQIALAGAPTSSDGEMLSEAYRVSVRIALDDGDLERAERDFDLAERHAVEPRAAAEIALLRAMIERALGRPATAAVTSAVKAGRECGDEGVLIEAHVLAAEIALAEGDDVAVERHVRHAAALRDDVADALPEHLRGRYLSRRDLSRLEVVERGLRQGGVPVAPAARAPRVSTVAAPRTLVGDDAAIRALLEGVRKVSRTDVTVLVYGESGTGKELVAEALHEGSPRRDAPLVKVNCAALVESLLLSELFGHEKGAFTGASGKKRGRFELAEGGTLFLDEIGDISPATQAALLRVLQERTFERVGGTSSVRADVRVVCATNRDLAAMVQAGTFREDLYFRLTGIVLRVPALRDRIGDLPLLARALLLRIAQERSEDPKALTPEAVSLLARHRWPGNVRELENALRAASLFSEGPAIRPSDLLDHVESMRSMRGHPVAALVPEARPTQPSQASQEGVEPASSDPTDVVYESLKAGKFGLFDVKRHLERECISRALAETRGNITRAAALLGMKRPRLSQLVKQYGLAVSSEGS